MSVAYVTHTPPTGLESPRDMIEILIPGNQAVFEAIFPLPEGRWQSALVRGPYVSIIPAGRPHHIKSQRHPEMVILALDPSFYREKVGNALGFAAPEIALHYAVVDPFIRELGNTMRSEFRMSLLPGSGYLESLAGVMAIHLATNYNRNTATTSASAGLPPYKFNRVLTFIKEHLAEPIQVEQLAAVVHMSPCHFARMFKQASGGQPPHVYITGQRMARAKELLRNTDLPLVDVAANAGFQTQAHFTGAFRKYSGVTPRIFRLSCRVGRLQAQCA